MLKRLPVGTKVRVARFLMGSAREKHSWLGIEAVIIHSSEDAEEEWPYLLSLDFRYYWCNEELDVISEPVSTVCSCSITELMRSGCHCGAFIRETQC